MFKTGDKVVVKKCNNSNSWRIGHVGVVTRVDSWGRSNGSRIGIRYDGSTTEYFFYPRNGDVVVGASKLAIVLK
jgi:threonine dehydrogenase-like Zn-dependent dehydrogenase